MSARRRHRKEFAQMRAAGWTVTVFRPWQRSRPIPLPGTGWPLLGGMPRTGKTWNRPVVFAVDECHEFLRRADDEAGAA